METENRKLIMADCKMRPEEIKKMRAERREKFAFLQENKKEN